MNDNFEKMFLDVINGKKSVRECEEVYGIDRNTFVKKCKERFPEGSEQRKKLETILSHNKGEFQKRDLDMERLKEAVNALLNGEIKMENRKFAIFHSPLSIINSPFTAGFRLHRRCRRRVRAWFRPYRYHCRRHRECRRRSGRWFSSGG